MARLRAVTFDVWQTLLHDPPESIPGRRTELRIEAMSHVIRDARLPIEPARLREAFRALDRHAAEVWKTREFDHEDQVRWLIEQAADGELPEIGDQLWAALLAAHVDPIHEAPPQPANFAREAIRAARDRGLRVGLICNTGYTPGYALRRLFNEWGILELFDDLAFSNEEGIRKPAPELFGRVAGRLDVAPGEIVHIGDDLITDIAGAKGAGYRAILVRPQRPAQIPVEPDAYIKQLSELPDVLDDWL